MESSEELYLLPSGYKAGDKPTVIESILDCSNPDFLGEVSVEKV